MNGVFTGDACFLMIHKHAKCFLSLSIILAKLLQIENSQRVPLKVRLNYVIFDILTHVFFLLTNKEITMYLTFDIITRGLYIFYPKFHSGLYCRAELFVLQETVVYNHERFQIKSRL